MALHEDEDDNPFACFGDSDDDDETAEQDASASASAASIAASLMGQANERMTQRSFNIYKSSVDSSQKLFNDNVKVDSIDPNGLGADNEQSLWPNCGPKYLGPIRLVSSLDFGGGRGYIATKALDSGTLLLVEEPIITWPQEQIGKDLGLVSVRYILHHDSCLDIVRDMEAFHPTKQDVDEDQDDNRIQIRDMMKFLHAEQDEDELKELVHLAKCRGVTSLNGEPLNARDIIRLLLVLRYNGLESGVYRHVAMLNHSCRFNCVKYQPTASKSYSEVRTTKPVAAGESLTISYLSSLASHATRRSHLWEQHRFDIGDNMDDSELLSMELVQQQFPTSSIHTVDETAPTWRVEKSCTQLEEMYNDLAPLLSSIDNGVMNEDMSKQVWEQLQALELSALELYTEAKLQLQNDHHLLLIRCLRLHVDVSSDVLKWSRLNSTQRINLLLRMVTSTHSLAELQAMYYGKDHFDVARTYLDLSQTIEELLSKSPKQLLDLRLDHMSTFEECASVEHTSLKEYQRIQALYPHDVEEKLKESGTM